MKRIYFIRHAPREGIGGISKTYLFEKEGFTCKTEGVLSKLVDTIAEREKDKKLVILSSPQRVAFWAADELDSQLRRKNFDLIFPRECLSWEPYTVTDPSKLDKERNVLPYYALSGDLLGEESAYLDILRLRNIFPDTFYQIVDGANQEFRTFKDANPNDPEKVANEGSRMRQELNRIGIKKQNEFIIPNLKCHGDKIRQVLSSLEGKVDAALMVTHADIFSYMEEVVRGMNLADPENILTRGISPNYLGFVSLDLEGKTVQLFQPTPRIEYR